MAHKPGKGKKPLKAAKLADVLSTIVNTEDGLSTSIRGAIKNLPPKERPIAEEVAAMKTALSNKSHMADAVSDSLHDMNTGFHRAMLLLSAFTRLSNILSSCANAAEIPHRIVKIFIDAFNFEQCSIMLHDVASDLLVHAAGAGQMDYFETLDGKHHAKEGISLKPGMGAAGKAAATMEPVIINDIAGDSAFIQSARGPTQGSVACIPMLYQGRLTGVVNFSHPSAGFFDEQIIRALAPMVNAVGQIIEMANLQRDLSTSNLSLEKTVEEKTRALMAANENLHNANRLKDDFMANISHELRTPLTSIIGFTRLIIDFHGMEEEERSSYLKIILERSQVLEKLLNDLLDLSRVETGNMPMNIERVNVGELASRCIEHFRLPAQSGGIAISAHIDQRPLLLHGDSQKLMQALGNLIHNAIKYTGTGGSIEVLVKELPQEIMVSVTDTGIGIEASQHQMIFERFRQAENRRNKAGGAGIGLNLAKHIIELHGGKIWVESDPGKGSTFTFCLPLEMRCDLNKPRPNDQLFSR